MTKLFKTNTETSVQTCAEAGNEVATKRELHPKRLDARNRARLYTARIWL